jgi:hypothetical protein
LLRRLEPRAGFTAKQLRTLVEQGCVVPEVRQTAHRGDSRVYGSTDVALLRLYVKLMHQGASRWVVKACLLGREAELRTAIASRLDAVLVLQGARAALVSAQRVPANASFAVPVRTVRAGVLEAAKCLRRDHRDIWTSWHRVDAREVERAAI